MSCDVTAIQELSRVEQTLNEKDAVIKEIELCVPEERDGIASSQLSLEEEASARKQERTEKIQSLEKQQQDLKVCFEYREEKQNCCVQVNCNEKYAAVYTTGTWLVSDHHL